LWSQLRSNHDNFLKRISGRQRDAQYAVSPKTGPSMRKDINAFSKRFALKDEQGAKVAVALGGTISPFRMDAKSLPFEVEASMAWTVNFSGD
jgi:hypothetical protein